MKITKAKNTTPPENRTLRVSIMRLKTQLTGSSLPQTYEGPQIVELVGVTVIGDQPAMVCIVDLSKQQKCDHFALREGQGYDQKAASPGGEPVDDQPPKTLGMVTTAKGVVVITSYCFA